MPEAIEWIDYSIPKMYPYRQPDGFIERLYGDGNWNRTLLLYALMKTQGWQLKDWRDGVELGAARDGEKLYVTVRSSAAWSGKVTFDYRRHRRELNLAKNYARLNQWPEWYTVDENTLYTVCDADTEKEEARLGSELKSGYEVKVARGGTRRIVVGPAR